MKKMKKARGRPSKEKTKVVSFRFPPDLYEVLERYGKEYPNDVGVAKTPHEAARALLAKAVLALKR